LFSAKGGVLFSFVTEPFFASNEAVAIVLPPGHELDGALNGGVVGKEFVAVRSLAIDSLRSLWAYRNVWK
jgi:hypothetical protein